ncbi:MAG: M48 family metalloprotease [Acidobacteriota bacterium]
MKTKLSFTIVLILLMSTTFFAQSNERDIEKEKVIWRELETVAPNALETFKAATVALDRGDYQEAARLYQEVLKQAPEFDHALRRLGGSLVELGKREEGLALAEAAVKKRGSPENLISLAQLLAYPGKNINSSPVDKQRALTLAKQANDLNKENDPHYPALVAQLALELDKTNEFHAATEILVKKHPDLMVTHYFNGISAAMKEDWIKAEEEIKKAQSLGLPADVAEKILASGIQSNATVWHYAYYTLYLFIVWIFGLVLLFLLGKILSNITLRSIETADPNAATSNQELSLRRYYRLLINIAGTYYYISIPMVIFLVIAISGSIFYGFLMLGRIPVKLVAIIGICAIVTVYQMIRSLFIRVKAEDAGRSLQPQEAPGLWTLTREVAESVGTRPIDEIRITPTTELAVYERGSYRERSQDRAERILILGVGLLNGFSQNAFRAVLAHEYGHFSHRDTAGGNVALRVNNDMMKFAKAIVLSGQAVWWNIAFQFLRVYHFIFRRISYGAVRLQEVLADRVAARIYGAKAFEEGLRHVIRRSVEFGSLATNEINEAMDTQRHLRNLYELKLIDEKSIEVEVNDELNRQTTEDDTHPSPQDRFRLVGRITTKHESADNGTVWELFTDRESITSEMSALVGTMVKAAATDG